QTAGICRVGGASSIHVPRYLSERFYNLSDSVDVDFFSPHRAKKRSESDVPIIYTPARVTPAKGQANVLRVASELKKRGIRTKVVFAGRIDSEKYKNELMELTEREKLTNGVEFLGQLNMEEYRGWYEKAELMLLLTEHQEGMPRAIIDSQAMEVPPLAYGMGG